MPRHAAPHDGPPLYSSSPPFLELRRRERRLLAFFEPFLAEPQHHANQSIQTHRSTTPHYKDTWPLNLNPYTKNETPKPQTLTYGDGNGACCLPSCFRSYPSVPSRGPPPSPARSARVCSHRCRSPGSRATCPSTSCGMLDVSARPQTRDENGDGTGDANSQNLHKNLQVSGSHPMDTTVMFSDGSA